MLRRTVATIVGLVLLAACSSAPRPSPSTPAGVDSPGETYYAPSSRAPLPRLSGTTLDGGRLTLAHLIGRDVVVLNVWASWCTECRTESRGLATLSAELTKGGVRFVGIDEQDVTHKARAFTAAEHVNYPQLVDADGSQLAKLTMLPSDGIPSTLVIDRQGRVAGRIIGAAHETRLRQLIARISTDH